jgi:hypothetical protein
LRVWRRDHAREIAGDSIFKQPDSKREQRLTRLRDLRRDAPSFTKIFRRSRAVPDALFAGRNAEVVLLIWVYGEAEYFCVRHWTGSITLNGREKFAFARIGKWREEEPFHAIVPAVSVGWSD